MTELATQSIAALGRALRCGDLSARELTEYYLQRAAQLNPSLHAYNCLTPERALMQADSADRDFAAGQDHGPLHGIPVAVKDLLDVEGLNTTASSPLCASRVATHTATAVLGLEVAGAICLGKLNMTEFALSGYHPDLPVPVNPWHAEHWSGVSSSGSGVAVAARLSCAALGSDTGGSIRLPAAANAVVGIKPTYGRVSRHGAFPLAESLDHIGPLANSVEDAALVLNAIAGYDAADPTSLKADREDFTRFLGQSVRGLRIGVDEQFNANADPAVGDALTAAIAQLAALGADIVATDLTGIEEGAERWFDLTAVEAAAHHHKLYPSRAEQYGPVFRSLLEHGHSLDGLAVSRAYTARGRVSQVLRRSFESIDALLCPSLATPPPSLGEFPPQLVLPPEVVGPIVLFQAPFNFSGNPTLSLPMGFTPAGLPLSLQLVGRHGEEATLIGLGHAYEQATDFHLRVAPGAALNSPSGSTPA